MSAQEEDEDYPVPPTRVLAIASHVLYGYVGNTIAAFVMQVLGCDVAALNTVQFSNHTGYRQFTGTRFPAEHIRDLYAGLKQSFLTDYDVLLSGYAPSAEVVEAVGSIARDLKFKATGKPGSFFWVLDPVMGDQGKLYVSEAVVPAYKAIIRDADLILPNLFEAETLSGVKINSLPNLVEAITLLHKAYSIPHIIVTSIQLPDGTTKTPTLTIVGSSISSNASGESSNKPRLFQIRVPYLDCLFVGTGDLFASLILVRLREESAKAGLLQTRSWLPAPDVRAPDLPLAKAAEKVLASMQAILEKTMEARERDLRQIGNLDREFGAGVDAIGADGSAAVPAPPSEKQEAMGTVSQEPEIEEKTNGSTEKGESKEERNRSGSSPTPSHDTPGSKPNDSSSSNITKELDGDTQDTTTTISTHANDDPNITSNPTPNQSQPQASNISSISSKPPSSTATTDEANAKRMHLLSTKLAEIRLIRNVRYLKHPPAPGSGMNGTAVPGQEDGENVVMGRAEEIKI